MFKHLQEMSQLNEAAAGHGFFQAKQYSDPGDFTDEFYDMATAITKIKKIMKNPKWLGYMQATDQANGTSTESAAQTAIQAVSDLEDALSTIDRQFDKVNLGADPYSSDDDSTPSDDDTDNDEQDDDDTQ